MLLYCNKLFTTSSAAFHLKLNEVRSFLLEYTKNNFGTMILVDTTIWFFLIRHVIFDLHCTYLWAKSGGGYCICVLRPVLMEKWIEFVGLKFSSQTLPAWTEKNSEEIIVGDHQKLLLYAYFQCSWDHIFNLDWFNGFWRRTMGSILMIFEEDVGHWRHTVYMHGNSTKIWSRIWSKVTNLTQFATILQTGLRLLLYPWQLH